MDKPADLYPISLLTLLSGARLLATAQDVDPATMESIVRKSGRVGCRAMQERAANERANDDA